MNSTSLRAEVRREGMLYAGELSARQAWDMLQSNGDASLIDVRTPPEWAYAGEPNISATGKRLIKLSWKLFPSYQLNEQFCSTLKAQAQDQNAPLLFLCRTGGRSREAAMAMTAEGYSQCFNITDGFDGPVNSAEQRGHIAGWRAAHLPWRQE